MGKESPHFVITMGDFVSRKKNKKGQLIFFSFLRQQKQDVCLQVVGLSDVDAVIAVLTTDHRLKVVKIVLAIAVVQHVLVGGGSFIRTIIAPAAASR